MSSFSLYFSLFYIFLAFRKHYLLYRTPNFPWVTKSESADIYLSSMRHLVLHGKNNFFLKPNRQSQCSSEGAKRWHPCPWLRIQARLYDLLQTYYVLLRRISYIYSNIDLAFTVYKAMSEAQGEGYHKRLISDLQTGQHRKYPPG